MKIILGTVAALMLSVAALSTPADAACWAGPNGWHCWHPPMIGSGAITGIGATIAGSF